MICTLATFLCNFDGFNSLFAIVGTVASNRAGKRITLNFYGSQKIVVRHFLVYEGTWQDKRKKIFTYFLQLIHCLIHTSNLLAVYTI